MYDLLERHMLEQMGDSAHDCQHVYRVLRTALDIAKAEAEVDQDGHVLDGTEKEPPSFFQEYQHKLKTLYGQFYTPRGGELAKERREIAEAFYQTLLLEARQGEIGLMAEILGGAF